MVIKLLTSEFHIRKWELLSAPHTFFPTELMEKVITSNLGFRFYNLGITTVD